MSRKRAAPVATSISSDEASNDTFYGFDSEDTNGPPLAKRMANVSSGRMSVISQYSETEGRVQRKPTRRPDPNIINRNALMARENRRRHKEHLERLENENSGLKRQNDMLKEKLKAKDTLLFKLQHEYKYLKSIIANKTQILDILKSISKTDIPMTSSLSNYKTVEIQPRKHLSSAVSSSSTDTAPSSGYDSPTLSEKSGTTDLDDLFKDAFDSHNFTFTDYEMNANALATDAWDTDPIFSDLPNTNNITEIDELLQYDAPETPESVNEVLDVQNEHSYSETIADPGVCVHISNKKVSIEFCAHCHNNATSGWIEEEIQVI